MGVVIYDQQGALVATTPELAKTLTVSPLVVTEAIAHNHSDSAFLKLGSVPAHILALPIRRKDEVVGGLAVVHDVSYIRAQSLLVWRQSFFRVLVQVFLIVLITLLIVRWSITGPIAQSRALDARPPHGEDFFPGSARPRDVPALGSRSGHHGGEPQPRPQRCRK